MTCLNDSHIQALADGEGGAEARRHALECADCAARVEARSALMASIVGAIDVPVAVPAPLTRRIEESFRHGGATRLRATERGWGWIYGGLGVAAATLIAVLFIVPAAAADHAPRARRP